MTDDSALSRLKAEYHTLYLISKIAKSKKQDSEFGMMKRVTDTMEHSFASKYDATYFAGIHKAKQHRAHTPPKPHQVLKKL